MTFLAEYMPYIQIVLSLLLIIAVILQQSSAGLGGAFGEAGFESGAHTKRGFEKVLFIATIILSILFVISAFLTLTIK